ncbi:hypothetical protein BCV72DRAFT_225799 [Rhizopus microsporus var. microsporus]|uniref:Uncharacterized protein n=2 Tax=Rhizopus microsporus TaxID=58291 RepID=A0A2G4SXX4_RHIZD|nr:uncharacterized protein RHIMIDRAFT_279843 [Rhizopus microsporus ATCC 52813]ORE07911.1 hypothetical protein BCV72DRAFT_225799 [Rhizopus microsporus var. microsporus]PHZ13595.1 hypothetical protein RHIMIDRAFT_279843 [Rhizopus microsporus ATCC 52813]
MKSVFTGVCVIDEEVNCFHYVIWHLLGTTIVTVDELKLHCDEYRLRSVDKELSRRNIRSNEHCKYDGCILTLIDGVRIELVLLKVTGPFKLDDESRFLKDHVKAGYGLIVMLNEITTLTNLLHLIHSPLFVSSYMQRKTSCGSGALRCLPLIFTYRTC